MIRSNWVRSFKAKLPIDWDLVMKYNTVRFTHAFIICFFFSFKGESLIARFMNMESYQRDAVTKMYCSRMLTQLLKNFRSHPDIINISNDIFYNSELQPCASIVKTHRYLGWWKLPVKNVPILFDATVGIAQKEGNSHRYLNRIRCSSSLRLY